MKRGRYTTVDNWATYQKVTAPYWWFEKGVTVPVFAIDECDVREVNGSVWPGGGRRVRLIEGKVPGFRQKTFIGETAWSDADRYAHDWAWKAERIYREAAAR